MNQIKKLDFSDHDIYIGLDIHKKNWTVTIIINDLEHKTFSQNPEPEILVNYLHRMFPNANYHAVYEAGYCGFWICDELTAKNIDCIVINAADIPTKDKEKKRKTNRVDSRKLARSLRNGDLDPIYVPDRKALKDRSLIRIRQNTIKDQTRYKNRIKAMLHFFGIRIPDRYRDGRWSGYFISWLQTITIKRPSGEKTLQSYVDEIKHYRQKVTALNREIRQLVKDDRYQKNVKLLKTIPGIGTLTAMILLTELIDINRFKNLDHLVSYLGVVPGERSSGEDNDTFITGLTPRTNRYLRAILIECAWVPARKNPALTLCYQVLIKRMCGQKAIIRIARKLLNRIRYVLKNEQPYVIAVVQ